MDFITFNKLKSWGSSTAPGDLLSILRSPTELLRDFGQVSYLISENCSSSTWSIRSLGQGVSIQHLATWGPSLKRPLDASIIQMRYHPSPTRDAELWLFWQAECIPILSWANHLSGRMCEIPPGYITVLWCDVHQECDRISPDGVRETARLSLPSRQTGIAVNDTWYHLTAV